MKTFNIPEKYKSSIIGKIKAKRKEEDPRKKDFSPTLLDLGPVQFLIARHFGFCYGVENAIEISYSAITENPGKRIFLLSQMIHNPEVNQDLESSGIRFIMDTEGNQFIPWDEIGKEDIVIIPAFGTTLEIENILLAKGIETKKYNTTCPFVERVWNRSEKLGAEDYTIIIHGKHKHEETRATFSHSKKNAPSIVIKNMEEAILLGDIILGKVPMEEFDKRFSDRCSEGFSPEKDLLRVGVINQTTMLASETQAIADYFRNVMIRKFPTDDQKSHFADTRDTLCYATNDNQQATFGLLDKDADLAIVIGGYNSSNTTHLVELLESKFPVFFINGDKDLLSTKDIRHFDIHRSEIKITKDYLPGNSPVRIIITSGASCPDAAVDRVIEKLSAFYGISVNAETIFSS